MKLRCQIVMTLTTKEGWAQGVRGRRAMTASQWSWPAERGLSGAVLIRRVQTGVSAGDTQGHRATPRGDRANLRGEEKNGVSVVLRLETLLGE